MTFPSRAEVRGSAQQPRLPELGPRGAGVWGAHLPLRLQDPGRPFPSRAVPSGRKNAHGELWPGVAAATGGDC